MPRKFNPRWFAWWYFSIGVGFALLAITSAMGGSTTWLVGLRVIIAVGFGLLGYAELRARSPRP